ncbi:Rieske (2Fe-2S) protein [Streptomyces sp. PSKA54]|uniref:Cytochrome bc1 complex Rieske iron-sulfur subunit n=1 Tax=Streptomyces himalayensis subsp. aureolus TaxID=2758039 RepID=A0A7W2HJ67_9ACTN|nr:Rieske (2Fe-2S) protein [Streptomyces himalayensis]MBA4865768.1 Rieske (2Fe-2S) protein [Streptomyces himalayensis subsp. aureolus]
MTSARARASRRTVLATGALAVVTAGCSKYGDEGGGSGADGGASAEAPATSQAPGPSQQSPQPSGASPSGQQSGGGQPGDNAPDGEALARTTDIPVGGGKVFADRKIVVTQPSEGDFRAFSAVCTHQWCTVRDVTGGTINCPCHASRFRVEDASVAGGPAPSPLEPRKITVTGKSIHLA